jgi:DNA-binding GntR family transcriptional regulator
VWQFRFVERYGGEPLPVNVELVDRRIVRSRRSWLDVLGADDSGYCELTRFVVVNKSLRCLSRVYVAISRFPKIMKVRESKLTGNLRRFLAEEFNAPTLSVEQFVRPCVFDKETCSLLEIRQGSAGMVTNIVGRSVGQEAITFQALWVPEGTYYLRVVPSAPPPA